MYTINNQTTSFIISRIIEEALIFSQSTYTMRNSFSFKRSFEDFEIEIGHVENSA